MVINEYNVLRLGMLGYIGDYCDGENILKWFRDEWRLTFNIRRDLPYPSSSRKIVTISGETWSEELSFESETKDDLYRNIIMTYLNSYFRCVDGKIIGPLLAFGPEVDTEWT